MPDDVQINIAGGLKFPLPRMARVRQIFEDHALADVGGAVTEQLERPEIAAKIKPGAKIAVGVGSRGVNNIQEAVRALIAGLKAQGAEPFIFPAMGSHGGGTEEGQRGVLEGYGITEEQVGATVRATMDTDVVAEMPDGTKLHVDRFANAADGIVLINRIKPHTSFRGPIESGICKMIIIGMGKIAGASSFHGGYGMDRFGEILPPAADLVRQHTKFLFGMGLVEDAFDNTAIVEAIPSENLMIREPELQARAKELIAKLYFDQIDVLVIDEIGKEISGAGADPNITGGAARGVTGFEKPRVEKMVMLDLTDATHGNACGIGSADVITQRLLSRVDFPVTYANIVTSTYLEGGRIPIAMSTEQDAVRLAAKTLPGKQPADARIVRIRNTLTLGEIMVSESMLDEVRNDDRMEILEEPSDMAYDTAA